MKAHKGMFPYEVIQVYADRDDPLALKVRPMIPITVYGKNRPFRTKALLDTGSGLTLVPTLLLSEGIIDLSDPEDSVTERITVASGQTVDVFFRVVDLEIRLKDRPYRWSALVAFAQDIKDVILGDVGFLRHFTVCFNGPKSYSQISLMGTLPEPVFARE